MRKEVKMMVRIFFIVWCLFFIVTDDLSSNDYLKINFTTEEKEWINKNPIVKVGVGVAFPPYMWVEKENGKNIFKGIVSDYLVKISERTGIEMKIELDIPFNEALSRGKDKEIDFFPCLSQTPERSKFLSFTGSYLSYPMVIITRENAPIIGSINDLNEKRIAIVKHLVVFSKIQNEYQNLNIDYIFTKTVDENLDAVSMGRADACIINLAVATYYTHKKGITNLKVAAPANMDGVQLSMGIRKDWAVFKNIVEKVLSSVTQEEKDSVSQRWIHMQYDFGINKTLVLKWSLGIGSLIVIIFVTFFVWNRRLQKVILGKEIAEKAYEESERMLTTLIGNLPGIAYRCLNDHNWTMLYLSDGCENLTGYKASELLHNDQKTYSDLILPKFRQYVWNEIQKSLVNNRSFTLEYKIKDKIGNEKWVYEKGISTKQDDEGIMILEGFITDITELKKAEEELYVNEERLRLAMQATRQSWFELNLKTWEVSTSPEFESIVGSDAGKSPTTYQGWIDSIHRNDRSAVLQCFSDCLKTGKISQMAYRMMTRKREWKWIYSSAKVVTFDENKLPVRMTGTHMDITERMNALKQTERLNRLNEKLLKHGDLAQKLKTITDEVINIFNADFARIWMIKHGDLCEVECHHAKTNKGPHVCRNREKCLHLMASSGRYIHIDGGHRRVPFDCYKIGRIAAGDESKFLTNDVCNDPHVHDHEWARILGLVSFAGYRLLSSDGHIIGVLALFSKQRISSEMNAQIENLVGTTTHIIQSAKAENEKAEIQVQLFQSQKMESIGTLAGGVAHDFNNILSSILGFSELALGGVEKGSETENDLHEIRMAGMRAKDLVKQILTFARQSDETVKPIQVDTIAEEVLKFLRSSIPATIQISENINSDSFIMGSPTQVHQILMNLCANASQSMEIKGGILELSLNDITIDKRSDISNLKFGEYIKMEVTDTGVGISPQNIDTIFEPYFTTKAVGEGTGMGLAVVHGIVESYGGKITIDSQLNKGTTFSVYLPITKKRKTYSTAKMSNLPSGNERILFVDDEAAIAKTGGRFLAQLGYAVTTRTSSIEALEMFRSKSQEFDLVITDMTMPNMTGDKLAVELIKIRPDIPIILCTGYSKTISEKNAADIGIKSFAYKPILQADLAKMARKTIDGAKNN